MILTTATPGSDGRYVYLEGEEPQNNWLSIELRGLQSETGGLGSRVYLTTPDGEVLMMEQDSGTHLASQNSTDLHFGLGAFDVADVRIVWADGYTQVVNGLAANQHILLTELRGSRFTNFLHGTNGGDELFGSTVADLVFGNEGSDLIVGEMGNDRLVGGGGDDRLLGEDGSDILLGQWGADRLRGGEGRDTLVGGTGNDVFVFTEASESIAPLRDVLRAAVDADAFEGAGSAPGDIISLSAIDADETAVGNQTFEFGGVGLGQISLINSPKGNTVVRGNVDSDVQFEFEILIEDGAVMASDYTEHDFFL